MRIALRGVIAIIGLLGLLIGAAIFANPAAPLGKLGLATLGGLGVSTARADMGGFFGGVGILALAAAARGEGRLLTAPLLLVTIALVGRIVTATVDGYTPDMAQPMGIEAFLVLAFAAGRRFLAAK